jgi:2-(1,2-epoxy-1,2-dihydrophenyl)acetyl-CoA isomerase
MQWRDGMTAVLKEVHNGIGRITLNRPNRLNALTGEMMQDLHTACQSLHAEAAVKVILIAGAGRAFCAGQDLSERDPRNLSEPLDLAKIQRDLFHPVVTLLRQTPKPVVACVNGIAAGAGAGIALASDIVLASEGASFAFSFAKVGLSVDAGLGQSLANRVGRARATALLMLGDTINAQEAMRAGLIWKAVPDDVLTTETEKLLDRLSATPKMAITGIKQSMAACHLDLSGYLAAEANAQGDAGAHSDYAEGVLAFLEKRSPKFS